ncbi:permease [Sorangium sp. So ce1078]|uniref:permease n=1 Tax=Sorangium sp. So ce1078 TaxID=3133329 RepID=UPI003F6310BD
MLALVVALSIAGLAVGPLLVALGRRRALPTSALDGLTLGLVPALVLARQLPHAVEEIGAQAVLWTALGYAALSLTEHRRRATGEVLGREIAFSALAVHGLLDGAGLALAAAAADGGADGLLFASAVLVHRLPEGLSLAARFLPAWGWRQLALRLGLLGLLTLLGALLGQRLMETLPHESFEVFIAFGLGVLLRLVVHTHEAPPRSRTARTASAVAFVSGLCVALALPSPESVFTHTHASELSIAESLGPLFVETAPAMLAGLAAAGLMRAFFPRRALGWPRFGAALSQPARGMAPWPPLPSSPGGALPLARGLLPAGAPVAAIVALAALAPALDVGGALLSLRLLGLPLTAVRVVGGALVAVLSALLVARVAGPPGAAPRSSAPTAAAGVSPSPGARLRAAADEAVGPALDHVAAWYLVGLVLAAVLEAMIEPAAARALGAPADIVVSALIAAPVHLCAQGATPLAAVMLHKGLSVGAVLAFLMVGPATSVAALAALKRSLGARAAAAFALSSVAIAVVVGLVANALVPGLVVPDLHDLAAHEHAAVEWVCAAALGALLLSSFTRLGPRAWFGHMLGTGDAPASGPAEPRAPDAHAHRCDARGDHPSWTAP